MQQGGFAIIIALMNYYTFASGNSSLFTGQKYAAKLKENGLVRKKNPLFCTPIVCRNLEKAKVAARLFPFKKILVYQIELFVDTTKTKVVYLNKFKPIVIINGFTEGVFFNNYHFLASYIYDDENDLGLKKTELLSTSDIFNREQFNKAKPIIFVGGKREDFELNEKNTAIGIDLNQKRQEIAQTAFDKGVGDVVGRGWNKQSTIEESGFVAGNTKWWDTKLDLLKAYRFNIAFENTVWKYYVTEKIWHSIKAGCLPVYWGKDSSIYETFPKKSFIDASDYQSSEEIVSFMINMTYDQWYERMEKCLHAYNESMKKMTYSKLDDAIEKIKERIF